MDSIKVSQFKTGDLIHGYYMIKSVIYKTSNTNTHFLDLILSDSTGDINAKLWNYTDSSELYADNMIIKIKGVITEWQSQKQLRIEKIRLTNEQDAVNIEDFVPVAPYKPEAMFQEIIRYMEKIENDQIKGIILDILTDKKEKLMYYPAAKSNHHSIRSGLLYHIMTMLNMAEKFIDIYQFLNKDLLYAGVILHDIEKLDEMNANELGMVDHYTTEGILLGHIIQGIKTIERVGHKLHADQETILLLEHMVLSHHYEPEYGSPKRPMIPEAEMLHYLDIIDARMFDMNKVINTLEEGDFSEKQWLMHNRQLYKAHTNKHENHSIQYKPDDES